MKKNEVGIWRTIDGVSRNPLGWHMGTRCDADLQKLVTAVNTGTCHFVTDEWGGFFRILPEKRHF